MILFASAQKPELESPIDHRFGRCPWLIKLDTVSGQWEALPNPGAGQSGGAGIAAAQLVIDHKGEVVISGDFGPHAAAALKAAGIQMRLYSAEISSISQASESIKQDKPAVFQ